MDLAHLRMLIHDFFNKDPDLVPYEAPLTILDIKSAVFMYKKDKGTNHNRNIDRIVHFLRNGENCKLHKIYWCEGGMQL